MAEDERIAMWNRRDRLVAELYASGLLPERTLYIRRQDGGVYAVGTPKDCAGAIALDWRSDTTGLSILEQPRLTIDPFEQKPDGFGGMFGFGEKGGVGWVLRLLDGENLVWETPLLPGATAVADLLCSEDHFFNGKRKKRDIPLWQLRPESAETCEQILSVWERLLNAKSNG